MNIDNKNLTEIEQINIEKIESHFGTDYILTSKHNLAYNCPYCEEKRGKLDRDHKFMVDAKTTMYWCFKCHTKGLLIKSSISNSEKIIPYLLDYFNLDEESNNKNRDSVINSDLIEFRDVIPIQKNSVAYEYLQSRKITDYQIERYNIMNGVGDNLGRIVIPNVLVSKWTDFYQGRSYIGAKNKYKNPENVDKTNIVFNLHNQRKKQERVYIVEGLFSAIRGGNDVLSIYGSSISEVQLKSIANYNFKEIYCCLDGDSAGQLGNKQLMNELIKCTNSTIYNVVLPEKEDPADMGEDVFKEYCEKHKRVFINNKLNNILSYFD